MIPMGTYGILSSVDTLVTYSTFSQTFKTLIHFSHHCSLVAQCCLIVLKCAWDERTKFFIHVCMYL